MSAPEARLGRWVLLYGILQVLSTVSVSTAGLKHADKVRYHTGPSLEGCPPWRSPDAAPLMIEACQQRSYCWVAPQTWSEPRATSGVPASPPGYSNHQYELTEPANSQVSSDYEATAGASGMHRNPSILQTALHSSTSTLNPVASRTPRGHASPLASPGSALRGPSLNPMRSPLASPSVISSPGSSGSPLSNGYSPNLDHKSESDLKVRPSASRDNVRSRPPTLFPPNRDARRISPELPAHRVANSPMSPLSLDGIASLPSPVLNSDQRIARDLAVQEARRRGEGPPQLGELSFGRDNVI